MYTKYHKDFEVGQNIFNTIKRQSTTILHLISWDGSLKVDCKIMHEFGEVWGMVVKLPLDKKYGKMYSRDETFIIDYLSQFRILEN